MKEKLSADEFISLLYRKAANVPLEEYAYWALDLLQQVISFDGAIWGTGHVSTEQFHTQTTVDVSPDIFKALKKYLAINPIFDSLLNTKGQAVDMADVLSDEYFYQSPVYLQCFKPFGIERILSSIHLEQRSGIFTLLTLYRYDRSQAFTSAEKQTQNRLLYHLLAASSYRQFLALNEGHQNVNGLASALCDQQGIYYAVESKFLDVIEQYIDIEESQCFPQPLSKQATEFSINNLHFNQESLGELFRLSVRVKNKIDDLTEREKQVVSGICQGSTFKQIAKQLQLSPSTVSNHLYRIYDKLNINSRSELVALAQNS